MQHSEQPFLELNRAREAIEALCTVQTFEDAEESWKHFLHRIERVWTKSQSHFGKSPKWDSWYGKYLKLRRQDPLLSYLINARGADEHTISEITQREASELSIKPGPSGEVFLNKLEFDKYGRPKVDVNSDAIVEFKPARLTLLPVKNRGVLYDVPREHLSQPIDPTNIVDIGRRALAFYTDFLNSAEAFFVGPTAARS